MLLLLGLVLLSSPVFCLTSELQSKFIDDVDSFNHQCYRDGVDDAPILGTRFKTNLPRKEVEKVMHKYLKDESYLKSVEAPTWEESIQRFEDIIMLNAPLPPKDMSSFYHDKLRSGNSLVKGKPVFLSGQENLDKKCLAINEPGGMIFGMLYHLYQHHQVFRDIGTLGAEKGKYDKSTLIQFLDEFMDVHSESLMPGDWPYRNKLADISAWSFLCFERWMNVILCGDVDDTSFEMVIHKCPKKNPIFNIRTGAVSMSVHFAEQLPVFAFLSILEPMRPHFKKELSCFMQEFIMMKYESINYLFRTMQSFEPSNKEYSHLVISSAQLVLSFSKNFANPTQIRELSWINKASKTLKYIDKVTQKRLETILVEEIQERVAQSLEEKWKAVLDATEFDAFKHAEKELHKELDRLELTNAKGLFKAAQEVYALQQQVVSIYQSDEEVSGGDIKKVVDLSLTVLGYVPYVGQVVRVGVTIYKTTEAILKSMESISAIHDRQLLSRSGSKGRSIIWCELNLVTDELVKKCKVSKTLRYMSFHRDKPCSSSGRWLFGTSMSDANNFLYSYGLKGIPQTISDFWMASISPFSKSEMNFDSKHKSAKGLLETLDKMCLMPSAHSHFPIFWRKMLGAENRKLLTNHKMYDSFISLHKSPSHSKIDKFLKEYVKDTTHHHEQLLDQAMLTLLCFEKWMDQAFCRLPTELTQIGFQFRKDSLCSDPKKNDREIAKVAERFLTIVPHLFIQNFWEPFLKQLVDNKFIITPEGTVYVESENIYRMVEFTFIRMKILTYYLKILKFGKDFYVEPGAYYRLRKQANEWLHGFAKAKNREQKVVTYFEGLLEGKSPKDLSEGEFLSELGFSMLPFSSEEFKTRLPTWVTKKTSALLKDSTDKALDQIECSTHFLRNLLSMLDKK